MAIERKVPPDIALANSAAATISLASDSARRTALLKIVQRYCGSDTLRRAFFTATRAIASDTERRRVLLGLLDGGERDAATVAILLRSAGSMSSNSEKGVVLRAVGRRNTLANQAVRREFFVATNTIAPNDDRTTVLLAVLGTRLAGRSEGSTTAVARAMIAAAWGLSSKTDKARVLRALVLGGWLKDARVQRKFEMCVASLGSGPEYHSVANTESE